MYVLFLFKVVATSAKLRQHHEKMRETYSKSEKLETHSEARGVSAVSKITGQALANGLTEQFSTETVDPAQPKSIQGQ